MNEFYAHGKLLLTGEYVVLDGAKALAIPTRLGQGMEINYHRGGDQLIWRSLNQNGVLWLDISLKPADLKTGYQGPYEAEAKRLIQILTAAEELKPGVWLDKFSTRAIFTTLEFDRQWGLGSSSTLIVLLAQYLELDPYQLLSKTFGGSGYDLACAEAEGPIIYQLLNGGDSQSGFFVLPQVSSLDWCPEWLANTYFVYLGKKQNSRAGIRHYRSRSVSTQDIDSISQLTDALWQSGGYDTAGLLASVPPAEVHKILQEHERIIGSLSQQTPVREKLFPDFPGTIKSLGAWGGDFVWAICDEPIEAVKAYFAKQGLQVVLPYHELALMG